MTVLSPDPRECGPSSSYTVARRFPGMSHRFRRLLISTFSMATITAAVFAFPALESRLLFAPAAQEADVPQGRGRGGGAAQVQPVDPLRFRYMGPAPAGRIAS